MMSASEYTGEPSTWYDQGSASDMTARLPFCDCNGDTTVNGVARAVYGDDEPGPFGPIRLGGIMSDTPLAGRVAVVSGGGRGLGRSFCRALARQGAKVVVNNRNRVTDADGRGPADHVAAEIVAAGGEAVAEHSDAADPADGEAIVAAAVGFPPTRPARAGCWRSAAERAGYQPRSAARPAGRERARRAAREAHGAVQGGGVRRVRSAH